MNRNSVSGNLIIIFVGLLFLGIGLGVVFGFALPNIKTAKASADWPATKGVVTESSVEKELKRSGSGKDKTSKTVYHPEICFEYNVEGQKHFSSQVQIGGTISYGSSASAHAVANKYPEGSAVEVYFDPENPSTAVLEPGLTSANYIPLVFGSIFAVIGFFMCAGTGFTFLVAMFAIGSSITDSSSGRQFKTEQPSYPDDRRPLDQSDLQVDQHRNNELDGREYQTAGSSADESVDGFTIQ